MNLGQQKLSFCLESLSINNQTFIAVTPCVTIVGYNDEIFWHVIIVTKRPHCTVHMFHLSFIPRIPSIVGK